jgi:hypothetical protein
MAAVRLARTDAGHGAAIMVFCLRSLRHLLALKCRSRAGKAMLKGGLPGQTVWGMCQRDRQLPAQSV